MGPNFALVFSIYFYTILIVDTKTNQTMEKKTMNMKKMILATFCVLAVSCIAQNAYAQSPRVEVAIVSAAMANMNTPKATVTTPAQPAETTPAATTESNEDGWDKVVGFFKKCVGAFCQSASSGRVSGREGAIMRGGEGMQTVIRESGKQNAQPAKKTNANTNNASQGRVYGREGAMMRAGEGFGAALHRANAKAAAGHAGSDK